jgi:hypothetical protein
MKTLSRFLRPRALVVAGLVFAAAPFTAGAQEAAMSSSGKWLGNFTGSMGASIRVENAKKDSESEARLEVLRAGSNTLVAWDIAEGVCGDNANPVVARAKFRQIQAGNDGTGNAKATIPRLDPKKRYYARVYSPENAAAPDGGTGSCVNLAEQPK